MKESMTKSEGQKEGKRIAYDGNILRKTIFQEIIAQCTTTELRIRFLFIKIQIRIRIISDQDLDLADRLDPDLI